MTSYIVRRVLFALPLLLFISLVSYAMLGLAPGGPAAVLGAAAQKMTPASRSAYLASLGLDKPWYVQYFYWLTTLLLHGSLGNSFQNGRPVIALLLEKLPITLEVALFSLVVTLAVALPLGVFSATNRGKPFDIGLSAVGFVAYGIPVAWLGVEMQQVFAVNLHWFPTSGGNSLGQSGFVDRLYHLVLPVATVSIISFAGWMRFQRGAMIETLDSPYVRTARAKGLTESAVIGRHALRNALIPTITLLGLTLPGLVAGTVIVENVFSIPGMGYLAVNSAFARDYPVVIAATMMTAVLVVVGNLLADIGYALVDPRISYD